MINPVAIFSSCPLGRMSSLESPATRHNHLHQRMLPASPPQGMELDPRPVEPPVDDDLSEGWGTVRQLDRGIPRRKKNKQTIESSQKKISEVHLWIC